MASYYVYSGAAGAGTGADWANAYTTLVTAISGKAVNDIFYVAHDHNETTAGAVSLTTPLGAQFLCVNRAGSVPPVAADLMTGAQVKTTGASNITVGLDSNYFYGITFNAGSDGTASAANVNCTGRAVKSEACHFRIGNTSASSRILVSNTNWWNNCTVQFGAITQGINANAVQFRWSNTPSAIAGATIPTALFVQTAGGAPILVEGVDLSAIPSGKSIFSATVIFAQMVFKDCKLASGVTVCATLNNINLHGVDLIRGDSGGTNYRHERYDGVGTLTTETTIVRSGGASDGTTPIAWKIVTAATANSRLPFEAFPISVWNDTTGGTKTITVEGVWGGGSVPDNNDIWIEVEYLGSASDPQGSFVSSGVATILTTPTSYASSSETWGGSTTKFKMSATTGTIQLKGPITVRIFAGLASSTFYVCPKVALS